MPQIKFIGAANWQSPVPQEHQIRMRSDERDDLLCRCTGCPTQTGAFGGLGQPLLYYQGVEYTYMKSSS